MRRFMICGLLLLIEVNSGMPLNRDTSGVSMACEFRSTVVNWGLPKHIVEEAYKLRLMKVNEDAPITQLVVIERGKVIYTSNQRFEYMAQSNFNFTSLSLSDNGTYQLRIIPYQGPPSDSKINLFVHPDSDCPDETLWTPQVFGVRIIFKSDSTAEVESGDNFTVRTLIPRSKLHVKVTITLGTGKEVCEGNARTNEYCEICDNVLPPGVYELTITFEHEILGIRHKTLTIKSVHIDDRYPVNLASMMSASNNNTTPTLIVLVLICISMIILIIVIIVLIVCLRKSRPKQNGLHA